MLLLSSGFFFATASQRDQYYRRSQSFVDIADAAAHILSHTNSDGNESDHECLACFENVEDSLLGESN